MTKEEIINLAKTCLILKGISIEKLTEADILYQYICSYYSGLKPKLRTLYFNLAAELLPSNRLYWLIRVIKIQPAKIPTNIREKIIKNPVMATLFAINIDKAYAEDTFKEASKDPTSLRLYRERLSCPKVIE